MNVHRAQAPEVKGRTGNLGARDDEAFCDALLPAVSRTFALSIQVLPSGLRGAVRTAYLLCRIVDTIEDEAELDAARREALFDDFDAAVTKVADGATVDLGGFIDRAEGVGAGADALLLAGCAAVFRSFRRLRADERAAIATPVLTMSRGMREYCRREAATGSLRLADMDDLERYCYFVAGTVGELLTALFRGFVPALEPEAAARVEAAAVPFGLGLQLVNIVKDVATDASRGVCFIPEAVLAAHGLTAARVLDPERRGDGLAAVVQLCERARTHLDAAIDYTLAWPTPEGTAVRRFCALPLALALATLREVEGGAETLRRGRTPKVSRATVMELAAAVARSVDDDDALRELLTRLR